MQRIRAGWNSLDASDFALIVVVVIGYVIAVVSRFSGAWPEVSIAVILVTFVITAVYLALARGADHFFERYPSGWAALAYFAILITLVTLLIILLGPGVWLVSLPLAALAAEFLPRRWQRWLVYLSILAGLMLPFVREGRYQEAFAFALTLSPAILFVVVFTRLALSEKEARKAAEALAAELEEANHQLAAYSTQVEDLARTRERNRLAREIHDSLGHYLTVANVQIRAAQVLMDSDPEKAQEALEKAQRLTQDGLTAVRRSVAALRESPLGGLMLVDAVEQLAVETRSSCSTVNVVVKGEPTRLHPGVELTLYRAAQEGLTNVCKHAGASRVDLTLDYSDSSQVSLTIADNGSGPSAGSSGGYGLLGIQERVDLLGGELTAGPGRTGDADDPAGFVLTITLPVAQTAETEVP